MYYKIPLYKPYLTNIEKSNVLEAVESGWISSRGSFVNKFEKEFSSFINRKHSISVCNGTVALYVALEALKLQKGTAIICPSLTYVSSANAIRFVGLVPLFVDCNKYGISDYSCIYSGLEYAKSKNIKVSAIMPVHLYGNVVDIDMISKNIPTEIKIIEDCAEAVGSKFKDKYCGNTASQFACYSFFGNKTMTTGEGGMICCNDDDLRLISYILKSVGQKPDAPQRYNHVMVGHNFRMTNICAAIGCGQLSRIDEIINNKKRVYNLYKKYFDENDLDIILPVPDFCESNYWLITVGMPNTIMREGLMLYLESFGIETRPAFLPMHAMKNLGDFYCVDDLKNCEDISSRYINLPSFPELTDNEIEYICDKVKRFIEHA